MGNRDNCDIVNSGLRSHPLNSSRYRDYCDRPIVFHLKYMYKTHKNKSDWPIEVYRVSLYLPESACMFAGLQHHASSK